MLSKMMAPDAATSYLESITSKKVEKTATLLNAAAVDTDKLNENEKSQKSKRSVNSNWEKYKDSIQDCVINQSNNGKKRCPNKQFTNSSCHLSSHGKRKTTEKSASTSTRTKRKQLNHPRPNMDLENMTLTKQVAIDCEMVGIGDGSDSMLARVSIVNRHGACIYDKYVKPQETVQDYRTSVSGIRPHHLKDGEEFNIVQNEVADIIKGRILVGHALKNDLSVLFLSHSKRLLRDTSRYNLFRRVTNGNTPSLKKLAAELLGIEIQTGEHNSIEDARTTMELYVLYKNRWESDIY